MPAVSCSKILRVIGQDLEIRGIKAFDIRNEGRKISSSVGISPPAATPVTLYYTPRDIKELRPQEEEKRGQSSEPERFFYSFSDAKSHRWICRPEKGPFRSTFQ